MSTETSSDEPVLIEETQGNVRILRLNRPAKKNALSGELTAAIVTAIDNASADSAVRVIGITGVGDTFCAGADLSPGKSRDSAEDTVERAVRKTCHCWH